MGEAVANKAGLDYERPSRTRERSYFCGHVGTIDIFKH